MSKIDISKLSTGEAAVVVIGAFLLVAALIVGTALLSGLAIWIVWNFAVPIVWLAAPHLPYWKAVIVGLILGFIKSFFFSND